MTALPTSAPPGIRFLHTADLQLGMPFHKILGDSGARLRERRLDAITLLGNLAHEHKAAFVVVAGDFFDANTAEDRVMHQALSRIRDARLPFLILPGNHDNAGPDSIYRRASFREACPKNLVVLCERTPHVVEGGRAVILPAPLFRRQQATDPTIHLVPEFGRDLAPNAVRIGIAHGSVVGFERDDDGNAPNLIPLGRAEAGALDYLALGDWHGTKQIDTRTWYSGTPEPTSFKGNKQGFALLVDIASPGATPRVSDVETARTRWLTHAATLYTASDVDRLGAFFDAIEASEDVVLDLVLQGALSLADRRRLGALVEAMRGRLLNLRASTRDVLPRPSDDELGDIAPDGFVKMTVERLRAHGAVGGDAELCAHIALGTLYRLGVEAQETSC